MLLTQLLIHFRGDDQLMWSKQRPLVMDAGQIHMEYFDWGIPPGANVLHSRCLIHMSCGGNTGLLYLLPHTAHLEMFPAIEYRMNGLLFSAIGGCCCCDDGGTVHTWVP